MFHSWIAGMPTSERGNTVTGCREIQIQGIQIQGIQLQVTGCREIQIQEYKYSCRLPGLKQVTSNFHRPLSFLNSSYPVLLL
jgi:hypothetical protein